MTPLETPPPPSAPLQSAPPPLKQPSGWNDGLLDATPSVSFPALLPDRGASPNEPKGRAPALPVPSFELLKFPSLHRLDLEDRQPSTAEAAVPRPVPIRPFECFRDRSPSYQLIADDELEGLSAEAASEREPPTSHTNHPQRPKLKIRPLKSGAETPSPLARRGVEERTYLENQLKAEEARRRRHAFENHQRRAGERLQSSPDREISALANEFAGFRLDDGDDAFRRWAPRKKSGRPAPSPPRILKSFQRSVSAKLADSRGQDGDACVLFFPDGNQLPLVDECNEGMSSRNSHASLFGMENCSSEEKCSSPQTQDLTEGSTRSTPFGISSCFSTPNSLECPIFLEEGGTTAHGGPSVGAGTMGSHKGNNKKVMLRPKMKVRPKTPAKRDGSEDTRAEGEDRAGIPGQIDLSHHFEHICSQLAGLPPTQDDDPSGRFDGHGWQSLDFPPDRAAETTERRDVRAAASTKHRPFPPPEEKTTDDSASSRCSHRTSASEATAVRKNGAASAPSFAADSFRLSFDADCSASSRTSKDQAVWDYSSPESFHRHPYRGKSVPGGPFPNHRDATPNEPFPLELKAPLSESNYVTPDHSNGAMRKQLGMKVSGVLDTLPELFLPSLGLEKRPGGGSRESLPSFLEQIQKVAS